MSREVVVLSAVRSPIGAFGGSLADMDPCDLASTVMKEAIARSNVDPAQINYVTVGTTMPVDSRYAYVSRVASIQAGLPMDSVAMQVSRLCASGLQGIVTTAQNILLGDSDYGIGGGVEVMSKVAYLMPALRSGARMGDAKAIDAMVAVLTDPFGVGHMGITAENLAAKYGFTREDQDAFAVESQRRAAAAIDAGHFKSQILPIVKQTRKGDVVFDTDEHLKRGTTMESLAKMKPAFKRTAPSPPVMLPASTTARPSSCWPMPPRLPLPARSRSPAWFPTPLPACRTTSWGEGPIPATKLALKKGRPDPGPDGCHRIQRSLCCSGPVGLQGARPGSGQDQPERRRHRPRPPGRLLRCFHRHQGNLRNEPYRRQVLPGHHVYRWRSGHRRDLRARLSI